MQQPTLKLSIGRVWLLNPAGRPHVVWHRSSLSLLWISGILPLLVALGSYWDGTWNLPGSGKGFLQHYGLWSFFLTTPIIVALVVFLLGRFHTTLTNDLERYCVGGMVPVALRERIDTHLRSLALQGKAKYVFVLLCVTGFYFAALNVRRTIEPLSTYGNDVFDAWSYTFGFAATKLYLTFVFGIIYPIVAFVTVHTTVSLFLILKQMRADHTLRIDFFDPDNCGGVSRFGSLNLLVMVIHMCILGVIFSLLETHAYRRSTITPPLLCTSAFLILQSVGTVYYLHKAVQQEREMALERVNKALNSSLDSLTRNDFPDHLLGVRKHLLSIKTYPYAGMALSLVNVIRVGPAFWAFVRLWL